MIKILLCFFLLIVVLACFRKKKDPNSFPDWLETRFPDRFQVLSTSTVDPIRNLSFKVKNTVIAEKSDPQVQAVVRWDSREPGLGVSAARIDSAMVSAARDVAEARALYQSLTNAGFDQVSVWVDRGDNQIMFFAEPSPGLRQQTLERLTAVLPVRPDRPGNSYYIEFWEPAEFNKHFQALVPMDEWSQYKSILIKHQIMALTCPMDQPLNPKSLGREWSFNAYGNRFSQYSDLAQNAAIAWADQHLKKPYKLTELSEYSQDKKNPLKFIFEYPFFYPDQTHTEEQPTDGKLVVSYDTDTKQLSPVSFQKD